MQRTRILALAAGAFALAAAAAAQQPAGDWHVDRPGAVYASLRTENAEACARRCADDGICMAWSYRIDRSCDLKAVAPAPVRAEGVISGLSPRAPDFAQRIAFEPLPPRSAAQAPTVGASAAPRVPAPAAEMDVAAALLGGPEAEPAYLRPRLGAAGNQ